MLPSLKNRLSTFLKKSYRIYVRNLCCCQKSTNKNYKDTFSNVQPLAI